MEQKIETEFINKIEKKQKINMDIESYIYLNINILTFQITDEIEK